MSMWLNIFFAGAGTIAVLATVATLKRHLPLIADLRRALLQPTETVELRLSIEEHAGQRTRFVSRRRHFRAPKPIRHRLHRNVRPAFA